MVLTYGNYCYSAKFHNHTFLAIDVLLQWRILYLYFYFPFFGILNKIYKDNFFKATKL